jgi:hypothetical protein
MTFVPSNATMLVADDAGHVFTGVSVAWDDENRRSGVLRVSESGDSCDLYVVGESEALQSDEVRLGPDGAVYLSGDFSYGKLVLPSP